MATAEHTLTTQTGAAPEPAARSIGNETSRRMLRFVAIFRAVVAIVLLAIALGFRNPQLLGIRDAGLFLASAASYCLFALLLLVWQWRRPVIVPRLVLVELLIDVLAITLDKYGNLIDQSDRVFTVSSPPDRFEAARVKDLVLPYNVALPQAGGYQVRLAMRDAESGQTGTALQYVVVK